MMMFRLAYAPTPGVLHAIRDRLKAERSTASLEPGTPAPELPGPLPPEHWLEVWQRQPGWSREFMLEFIAAIQADARKGE